MRGSGTLADPANMCVGVGPSVFQFLVTDSLKQTLPGGRWKFQVAAHDELDMVKMALGYHA
jgi:hypothetical protein